MVGRLPADAGHRAAVVVVDGSITKDGYCVLFQIFLYIKNNTLMKDSIISLTNLPINEVKMARILNFTYHLLPEDIMVKSFISEV